MCVTDPCQAAGVPSPRWSSRKVSSALAMSVVVAALSAALAPPTLASAGQFAQPVVLSVRATSRSLPDTGGVVHFTVTLRGANACRLGVAGSPGVTVASPGAWQRCANGVFRHAVSIGANAAPAARTVVLRLYLRRGAALYWYALGGVRVAGEPAASAPTASLALSADTVSSAGGLVTLTYSSTNASSCSLASSPPLWTGSDPAVVDCAGTYQVSVPSASASGQWTLTFTAGAAGRSASATRTLTEQAPLVTLTGTSVAMALASSASNGSTSSLSVNYTASLSAACTYSNGVTDPCAVPGGTVTFELDGVDNGGNATYLSSAASNCATAVRGATAVATCDVTWATYGDQWVTATYEDGSDPSVSQTVEVQVVAPVDLAAGYTYSTYDNAGPGAVGDCTMASVADWIETTFATAPSDQSTVAAYWAAEDQYNGGADVGLTTPQLFAFWTNVGIDGTYLTASDPLSGQSEIESMLSSQYVLLATANLPSNFPPGSGSAGGHMWLVVGYSDYGPMIVSWGQEFQISWAEFDSWTTGVWSIGATTP